MSIFDIATRQAEWLALRRTQVANNIANANTPGYRARDIISFDAYLQRPSASKLPVGLGSSAVADGLQAPPPDDPLIDTLETGNSVDLDNELMKAGDIARNHALNVGLVRAFHRMMLLSSKG